MAEGRVAPSLPKGPSVRPLPAKPIGVAFTDVDYVTKVPARQVPPVPGGRAPPKPPNKPPAAATPADSQPVSMRGTDVRAVPAKILPRPASVSGDTSVKKRPEITVVCARPISEVGFRHLSKAKTQSNGNTAQTSDQSKPAVEPTSRTLPPIPPLSESTSRKLPPIPPRTDREDGGQKKTVHTARPSGRPPPIPQQAPNQVPPSTKPRIVPPPSPRPRNIEAKSEEKTSTHDTDDSHTLSPQVFHSSDSLLQENISLLDEPNLLVPLKPVPLKEKTTFAGTQSSSEDLSGEGTPNDTVVKWPSRPTIIRPQKKSPVQKSQLECTVDTTSIEVTFNGTSQTSDEKITKGDNSNTNVEKSENLDVSPELRPKPVARERSKSMSIADSIKIFESEAKSESEKPKLNKPPPPLAPKPKPTVLPKPKQGKSSDVSSPSESAPVSTPSQPPEILTEHQELPLSDLHKTNEEEHIFKPPLQAAKTTKRPTIIRAPPKPNRGSTSSIGNFDDSEKKVNEKVEETISVHVPQVKRRVKTTVDDSVVRSGNKAPPLPNRRPVSIAGIPLGLSLHEMPQDGAEPSTADNGRPKPAMRSFISNEPKTEGQSRPFRIIGRPPPPVVRPTNEGSEDKRLNRPAVPNLVKRPVSTAADGDPTMRSKGSGRPSPEGRPPRPTSMDPRLTSTEMLSKPPIGRPLPSSPRERLTTLGESSGTTPTTDQPVDPTVKKSPPGRPQHPTRPTEPRTVPGDEEGQPRAKPSRPTSVHMRPSISPSKATSRTGHSGGKLEKTQPPRPDSLRRTSMPQMLPPKKASSPPRLPSRPKPGHPLYHYMAGVPHGIALHSFVGAHEEDLSFKTDEVVFLVGRMDEAWLRGKIDDREGIFPEEFIQIVVPLLNESPPVYPAPADRAGASVSAWVEEGYDGKTDTQLMEKPDLIGHGPRCCARFDFEGEGEKDLQFEEGDYIRLLEKIGDEWAQGEINGREGIFPLVYVEIIEDLPTLDRGQETQISPETEGPHIHSSPPPAKAQVSKGYQSVTAMYDFSASDPGDLPLNAGDQVTVLSVVNGEWLYGECHGQKGQFPAQFIHVVPENLPKYDPSEIPTSSSAISDRSASGSDLPLTEKIYCVALHSFRSENENELDFSEGERILFLEDLGSDWFRGKLKDKEGIFPSNFVQKESKHQGNPQVGGRSNDKQSVKHGVAIFDFDAQDTNELSLKTGDRVLLGDIVIGASDWRLGEVGDRRGMFPVAFVESES